MAGLDTSYASQQFVFGNADTMVYLFAISFIFAYTVCINFVEYVSQSSIMNYLVLYNFFIVLIGLIALFADMYKV